MIESDHESIQENVPDQPDVDNSSGEEAKQQPPTKRGRINFITPRLVAALDNCKISDRYATHTLAAVAEALGHSLQDLVINRESIRRCRDKYREQMAKQIKEDFQASVN